MRNEWIWNEWNQGGSWKREWVKVITSTNCWMRWFEVNEMIWIDGLFGKSDEMSGEKTLRWPMWIDITGLNMIGTKDYKTHSFLQMRYELQLYQETFLNHTLLSMLVYIHLIGRWLRKTVIICRIFILLGSGSCIILKALMCGVVIFRI